MYDCMASPVLLEYRLPFNHEDHEDFPYRSCPCRKLNATIRRYPGAQDNSQRSYRWYQLQEYRCGARVRSSPIDSFSEGNLPRLSLMIDTLTARPTERDRDLRDKRLAWSQDYSSNRRYASLDYLNLSERKGGFVTEVLYTFYSFILNWYIFIYIPSLCFEFLNL